MKNIFRNPEKSLAAKLIIAIGVLIIVISFIFWYAILSKQKKDIMAVAIKYGTSFVEFAKVSTHDSMLTFQRDATQKALENLGTPEGIQRVRIYDHSGKVFFSSQKSDVGELVDIKSIACTGCHTRPDQTSELTPEQRTWEVYDDSSGASALRMLGTVSNTPACYSASCHFHDKNQKILGFVEADMSLSLLDEALLKQRLALTAYVGVFVIIMSVSLGIINYKIVTHPIDELSHGMEQVIAGDLDHTVPVKSMDEMGVLANTFNLMIKDIKAAREQRERWTQTLEEEVAKKTEEIKKTQAGLIQTQKLASLGRMAAGVAHEINNPLTGVVTFAHLLRDRFPKDSSEVEDINIIIEQAERCSKIIKNLLTFARATPSEKGKTSVNEVLSRTVFMVKNQEKFHHIKFNVNLEEAQFITDGDATQFQQIFLNMFINAADAMDERGNITVSTRKLIEDERELVEIEFTDEGCGIGEEDMSKLFEPFFTTKPVGKGTGLGLSVSHGIVKHMGGHIKVESTVGKGTSFFVRLPLSVEGGKEA